MGEGGKDFRVAHSRTEGDKLPRN